MPAATIAPRLVRRLLNDIGDNQDELPVLQHALMRTWEHWHGHNAPASPIDLVNYESIGTLRKALSLHAEEAYAETLDEPRPWITQRVFKALTDTYSDPRGVRRPTSIAEMASACEVGEDEVIRIVEIFRRPGRSFLMPPSPVPLTPRTIVDLSHESLMRCWPRLMRWAEEERGSGELYSRLSREAAWHASGKAGLWDDPELELGLRWLRLEPSDRGLGAPLRRGLRAGDGVPRSRASGNARGSATSGGRCASAGCSSPGGRPRCCS